MTSYTVAVRASCWKSWRCNMKTLNDILRSIICGIMPRSETGIIMEMIAYYMAYDWRL